MRQLLIIAAAVAAVVLARLWLKQPPRARLRWLLYAAAAAVLVLAATGKLHWLAAIGAAIAGALPVIAKKLFLLFRYLPLISGLMSRFGRGKGAGAQGSSRHGSGAQRRTGGMTRKEALKVLGLKPGATREEVIQAHKRLMQKMHPDRGGSPHLAAEINQAKEVLLGQ